MAKLPLPGNTLAGPACAGRFYSSTGAWCVPLGILPAAVWHSPLFGLTDFVHVSETDNSNDEPEGVGERPDLHTAAQQQSVCNLNHICGKGSLVCCVVGVVRGASRGR